MKISKLVVLTVEVQYALHSTQRENDMLFIPLNFPLSRPRFSIIFFLRSCLFLSVVLAHLVDPLLPKVRQLPWIYVYRVPKMSQNLLCLFKREIYLSASDC